MEPSENIVWTLPEYLIAGTLFGYHADLDEFIQRDVPSNRISMEGIWSERDLWTQFFFDSRTKNMYTGGFPDGERPKHVQLVLIPTLPYCSRLGIHVTTYHEKQAETKQTLVKAIPFLKQNRRKQSKGKGIS